MFDLFDVVLNLWRHLQPLCKALSCLRLPNWVEESSLVILTILCWYFHPPAISLYYKKMNASPPALGCPCEPALHRYQQEWPVQYHKPITRSGQPRAGRVAQGQSTRSLGKPKLQAAQPNASGNQLHPGPAPPVHPAKVLRCRAWAESVPPTRKQLLLTRPCITGQCARLAPDQTLGRALYRASPRCSVRRRKRAQWLLWRKGARVAADCRWTGHSCSGSAAHDTRQVYYGRPRACMMSVIMDQANLASFLHRLVKSSICRANSFYFILLYLFFHVFWFCHLFLPHRCVSREGNARFWESLHW